MDPQPWRLRSEVVWWRHDSILSWVGYYGLILSTKPKVVCNLITIDRSLRTSCLLYVLRVGGKFAKSRTSICSRVRSLSQFGRGCMSVRVVTHAAKSFFVARWVLTIWWTCLQFSYGRTAHVPGYGRGRTNNIGRIALITRLHVEYFPLFSCVRCETTVLFAKRKYLGRWCSAQGILQGRRKNILNFTISLNGFKNAADQSWASLSYFFPNLGPVLA